MREDTPPLNREAVELGFVLKQIEDYEFSMAKFVDRLKLQKIVYLMQAFGVYLGYDFSWYLRGPYCTVLAANGFSLQDVYARIPLRDVKFDDKKSQKMFERFLKFVKDKNIDELEIAVSLHYLNQICGIPYDEAKSKVKNEQKRFNKAQVKGVWKEMKKCQLIRSQ